MLNMKNKDLIMLGIIIGITFFFVGAIISNVFPSSSENLLSYKVSASIKLIGIGFLTSAMVVGGIIIDDIDKNLKMLLLILGLILVFIYTVGAQALTWDIPIAGMASDGDAAYESRPTALGTPGFEVIYGIIALAVVSLIAKMKHKV